MAAQTTAAASVTAFGAACCACPAAALGCAAALLAAGLNTNACTQLLSVALEGTAIGALLLALLAALLQLLAAEPQEPWSEQRSQRVKQVGNEAQRRQTCHQMANVGSTWVQSTAQLQCVSASAAPAASSAMHLPRA
jgi:hypothetical protein